MKASKAIVATAAVLLAMVSAAKADTFGPVGNQFQIDFVTISDTTPPTNPTSGYGIVANDYRMGKFEITNAQWTKFKANLASQNPPVSSVTGTPSGAYSESPYWTGTDVPTNMVSWYEAAQFVNWLNTSTGHQAAYNFTGEQGQSGYTLAVWSSAEADNGTNLYRHKNAKYYLPTEDEWVKAAYWNGTELQTYATKAGESLTQGNGTSGTGWNYYNTDTDQYATDPAGPWNVGSGSEELNGTRDMMGNVYEWMESPWSSGDYGADSTRGMRGRSYSPSGGGVPNATVASSYRFYGPPGFENEIVGFRVASEVPEPATLSLLALGGLALLRRKKVTRI